MTDAPDEISGDDPVAEEFFSEPRIRVDEPESEATDPRGEAARAAIERAFVRARRARLARYVVGATCAAIVVCAAAVARTMMGEAPLASASSAPSPSSSAAAAAASAQTEPAWMPPPEVALQARQALASARDALGRDDHEAAITAAARSIALDPTAGSAWLLLGDAYDRAGRPEEARKAYRTCLDEARSDADQCVAHLR
jgi:tetratricopeptide (TPR) repeat protein